jgi:hypothetical protein
MKHQLAHRYHRLIASFPGLDRYLQSKMLVIPCESSKTHCLGLSNSRAFQQVVPPNFTEDSKNSILSKSPKSSSVLCKASGVQKSRQIPPSRPKAWTVKEDKTLLELRSKGLVWAAISEKIPGRTQLASRITYPGHTSGGIGRRW